MSPASSRFFLRDVPFWCAVLVAPIAWCLLWLLFSQPVTLARSLTLQFVLMTIVVYPVLEELVFRGALQGWLLSMENFQRALAGVSLANLITSVIFTGLHFLNHSPMWALLVLGPSLIFGWARDRYGSVLPSTLLHVFYNAGFLYLFG